MSAPIVRAKFTLTKREEDQNGFTLYFQPVTSGSAENDKFFKWTPWGELKMGTVNPDAARAFVVGQAYYLDFSPSVAVANAA